MATMIMWSAIIQVVRHHVGKLITAIGLRIRTLDLLLKYVSGRIRTLDLLLKYVSGHVIWYHG